LKNLQNFRDSSINKIKLNGLYVKRQDLGFFGIKTNYFYIEKGLENK
jgi:hypothetical protein